MVSDDPVVASATDNSKAGKKCEAEYLKQSPVKN